MQRQRAALASWISFRAAPWLLLCKLFKGCRSRVQNRKVPSPFFIQGVPPDPPAKDMVRTWWLM